MNKIVVFSGASHSGKSVMMNRLRECNPHIINYGEIIRTKFPKPIDELRKDYKEYLKVEYDIIGNKIFQEENCSNEYSDKIIIFDRSLVDSLYYFTTYLNKNDFDTDELFEYEKFLKFLLNKIEDHFENIYNKVFLFKPIKDIKVYDSMRPEKLSLIQDNEYNLIRSMTYGFTKDLNKIVEVNAINDFNKISKILRTL